MEHLNHLGVKYSTWCPPEEYQVWEIWKERSGTAEDMSTRRISRGNLESVCDNNDLFQDSRDVAGPKLQLLVAANILSSTWTHEKAGIDAKGVKELRREFREAMKAGQPPYQETVDKARHMPFDRSIFAKVSAQIGTPSGYALQLYRKHHTTYLEANISRGGKRLKGFICQTPFLTDSDFFISLAVSYDPQTLHYRGILHFLLDEGRYDSFRRDIFVTRHLVEHPLLLPIAVFNIADTHNRLQYRRVDNLIRDTLTASSQPDPSNDMKLEHFARSLEESSERLRRLQFYQVSLIGSLSDYLQSSQTILSNAFHTITTPNLNLEVTEELQEYFNNVGLDTPHQLATRTRLDLQIQQALTRMEHEHTAISLRQAQYSKQDAEVMGVISVITMVFLPATALATIFSMSLFFSTTPDGKGVVVSRSFWVFVVVAVLLTLVIVCAWVAWTWDTRRKIRASEVAEKGSSGRSWAGWSLFLRRRVVSDGRDGALGQESGSSTGIDGTMSVGMPAPRDKKTSYASLFPIPSFRGTARSDRASSHMP